MKLHKSGVIAAGLALFSMFFGAGTLVWPLILGARAGDHNLSCVLGFLISGVSLPLLGLLSIMLFYGDVKEFFGRVGKLGGFILIFIVQAILGPIGSLPRLITLAHATIAPYIPMSLLTFSVSACILVFLFTIRPQRIVDILGVILAPALLLCLAIIMIVGLLSHPAPQQMLITDGQAFMEGLRGGYNTLDMIASFIFAPIVIGYFIKDESDFASESGHRHVVSKMLKASLIAGGLIATMFFGLTYLSAYYTPILPAHDEAARLGLIARHLIGPAGALFAAIAITLSCLTTAIPIALISANYLRTELCRDKIPQNVATIVPLAIAMLLANLGFMGIAKMLEPVLQIICPGLIILCIFNILHKTYKMKTPRVPIYCAFGISLIGYFALPYL